MCVCVCVWLSCLGSAKHKPEAKMCFIIVAIVENKRIVVWFSRYFFSILSRVIVCVVVVFFGFVHWILVLRFDHFFCMPFPSFFFWINWLPRFYSSLPMDFVFSAIDSGPCQWDTILMLLFTLVSVIFLRINATITY